MKVSKYSPTCVSDHLYWKTTFMLAWFTVWAIPNQFIKIFHTSPSELDKIYGKLHSLLLWLPRNSLLNMLLVTIWSILSTFYIATPSFLETLKGWVKFYFHDAICTKSAIFLYKGLYVWVKSDFQNTLFSCIIFARY